MWRGPPAYRLSWPGYCWTGPSAARWHGAGTAATLTECLPAGRIPGMATDLPDRLDLAWELRLGADTYREEFGCAPAGVWHAPGTITLLADGPTQLTVSARWGAIVAAGPRADGIIEPIRMNRPDERLRLTVGEAAAGAGPSWAGPGLRSAREGASLLINTDLPEGSGVGAALATQSAIGLALRGLADPEDLGAEDLGARD